MICKIISWFGKFSFRDLSSWYCLWTIYVVRELCDITLKYLNKIRAFPCVDWPIHFLCRGQFVTHWNPFCKFWNRLSSGKFASSVSSLLSSLSRYSGWALILILILHKGATFNTMFWCRLQRQALWEIKDSSKMCLGLMAYLRWYFLAIRPATILWSECLDLLALPSLEAFTSQRVGLLTFSFLLGVSYSFSTKSSVCFPWVVVYHSFCSSLLSSLAV